ncbi:MAG: hypothetical protein IKP06_02610 [Elusimicrobiaceae bacterium]|nr:hypothetical protein [Elusimicrobiaceae bacterium]
MEKDLSAVARELQNTFDSQFYQKAPFIPSAKETIEIFCTLRDLLYAYPYACQSTPCEEVLTQLAKRLEVQLKNCLCFFCTEKKDCAVCEQQSKQLTHDFLAALPSIQKLLLSDVTAAYEGDPAAIHPLEPLLCYPGITAITFQRLAHFLYKRGVRLLPRIVTEYAHTLTGIDIHPGAEIGPSFFIDHGTGVVIGETCVIGANVKLYQGVTLGAKSFPLDENGNPVKGIKRHPNIGDNVTIYAEATILGPVTVGDGCTIGANKWITQDVPPHTKIN